jgi:hypothetical protein
VRRDTLIRERTTPVDQSQASLPSFTGLQVHYDEQFDFSVLIPVGWRRLAIDPGVGDFYVPDPNDPLTGFAVEGRDLATEVKPGDLSAVRRGFLQGLRQLPDCKIESREAEAIGPLITLEARHTYREASTIRKRWARLLYQGRTQVRLIAQGATVEQFDYWEPMFFSTMRTVRFGRY